eukprot:364450-Chlamydomonas_euryale.AAC.1
MVEFDACRDEFDACRDAGYATNHQQAAINRCPTATNRHAGRQGPGAGVSTNRADGRPAGVQKRGERGSGKARSHGCARVAWTVNV